LHAAYDPLQELDGGATVAERHGARRRWSPATGHPVRWRREHEVGALALAAEPEALELADISNENGS